MFIVEQDRELVLGNSFNLNSLIEINEHDSLYKIHEGCLPIWHWEDYYDNIMLNLTEDVSIGD